MASSRKFTALSVRHITAPGRYAAGDGLYLQVSPAGTKSWLLRYMLDGRARQMGLGSVDLVSLAEAREKARSARKQLLEGVDPIEARRQARRQAKAKSAAGMTFRECADLYLSARETGWRNEKRRAQWRSTLASYAFPVIGDVDVAAIDVAMVLKCVEPIWRTKTETASRLRGRIEAVLDWAAVRNLRTGENPARWRGHLDKVLPSKRRVAPVKHHSALPFSDIPAFMKSLRERDDVSSKCLGFVVLTAVRTSEATNAQWSEIDMERCVWMIPAARMKASREHRVPLSKPAIEILKSLPREADFVFLGARALKPLSNMALLKVLERMGRSDLTMHGFRSTFRDWCSETTAYPREVAEMALAHTISDSVEGAYRRGDLFRKREQLMQDWARYCGSQAACALPDEIKTLEPEWPLRGQLGHHRRAC